jgi:hypothetical protein
MCTRITYNDRDTINAFNFDIDLSAWNHKVFQETDRFFIGIKMPDGLYHSYHGINKNGNVGTLLYVHGNETAAYKGSSETVTIADLTEKFIKASISFDEAVEIVKTKHITYAPDATMQAMLSDKSGRVLIVEPGIGYRVERQRYSLITNYSLLNPEGTFPFIVPGDNRYEHAKEMLDHHVGEFSLEDALACLCEVKQEGLWATRVSFVYSEKEHRGLYALSNHFEEIQEFSFL